MTRNLSVFLDLLRLAAAALVLAGHAGEIFHLPLPDIVLHSAKEGVAIFFVLSGFVIAFTASSKEADWQAFAKARAVRLYSVVPLALAVLVVCHVVGSAREAGLYGDISGSNDGVLFGSPPEWRSLLRYLTFTNEIWFDRAVIVTGAPFWSLGFEVAYYIAFAIAFYGRSAWRWPLAMAWLMACGPRIALAFPLWLIGAAAWWASQRMPKMDRAHIAVPIVLFGVVALRRWYGAAATPLFELPALHDLVPSMAYYLALSVGIAAAIMLLTVSAPERLIWPQPLVRVVHFAAGASFTLYIMHLPLLTLIAALWPRSRVSTGAGVLATCLAIAAIFLLAELGERRKSAYRRGFAKLFSVIFKRMEKPRDAID